MSTNAPATLQHKLHSKLANLFRTLQWRATANQNVFMVYQELPRRGKEEHLQAPLFNIISEAK